MRKLRASRKKKLVIYIAKGLTRGQAYLRAMKKRPKGSPDFRAFVYVKKTGRVVFL